MSDPIVPDTKDWTWTLTRACDECGLAAGEVDPAEIAPRAFVAAEEWAHILRESPAVTGRPSPDRWSPLEYGAHVRDVFKIFDERLRLMLTEDEPQFPTWDQDAAAIEGGYADEDPEDVADQLEEVAQRFVERYAAVTPEQLERRGIRSNGSEFTIRTLGQYFLHDIVHHLWDVTGEPDPTTWLEVEPD